MIDLIRFFNKPEHVQKFLDGDLFMHSLGHFQMLDDTVQNDIFEGTIETVTPEAFAERFNNDPIEMFRGHIITPISSRMEAYKYVHVLCCVIHAYAPGKKEVEKIPVAMRGFGKYAVRIYNVEEFVDRIINTLKSNGQYGLMGPMNYHSANELSGYRDCFDKNSTHAYESEWRFALIPDYDEAKRMAKKDSTGAETYDSYINYPIGSIRDIAEEIDTDILFNNPSLLYSERHDFKTVDGLSITWREMSKAINILYEGYGIPYSYDMNPNQYMGWAPREAFHSKVMGINPGIKPLITIG